MKKIAVVLAGCGRADGSEIHEAVLCLLAIAKAGCQYLCFAPQESQSSVINHLSGAKMAESRSMLVESARIARGKIQDLRELTCDLADAVVFPGGLGAAANLSNFAEKGAACEVHPEVARVVNDFHGGKKPLGFICIAPVLAARLIPGVQITIGEDKDTACAVEEMGAKHVRAKCEDIVLDPVHRVVSTPAYMLAKSIAEVEIGISRLIHELVKMTS